MALNPGDYTTVVELARLALGSDSIVSELDLADAEVERLLKLLEQQRDPVGPGYTCDGECAGCSSLDCHDRKAEHDPAVCGCKYRGAGIYSCGWQENGGSE